MNAKRLVSVVGILLVLAGLLGGAAQAASLLPSLHVGSVLASYSLTATGTSPSTSAASYLIWAVVTVHDMQHRPLPGATVMVQWLEPNGIHVIEQATTNSQGQARFQIASALQGMYRVSVTNVARTGWGYDATQNEFTSARLQVPRLNCTDGSCPVPEPSARLICINDLCPSPLPVPVARVICIDGLCPTPIAAPTVS